MTFNPKDHHVTGEYRIVKAGEYYLDRGEVFLATVESGYCFHIVRLVRPFPVMNWPDSIEKRLEAVEKAVEALKPYGSDLQLSGVRQQNGN